MLREVCLYGEFLQVGTRALGKRVSVWPGVAAPPSPGLAERERCPLAALIGEQWCL